MEVRGRPGASLGGSAGGVKVDMHNNQTTHQMLTFDQWVISKSQPQSLHFHYASSNSGNKMTVYYQ